MQIISCVLHQASPKTSFIFLSCLPSLLPSLLPTSTNISPFRSQPPPSTLTPLSPPNRLLAVRQYYRRSKGYRKFRKLWGHHLFGAAQPTRYRCELAVACFSMIKAFHRLVPRSNSAPSSPPTRNHPNWSSADGRVECTVLLFGCYLDVHCFSNLISTVCTFE